MSDPETDDTDALLAYKPPTFAAIENFIGLSLGEISNQINSLSICENNNHADPSVLSPSDTDTHEQFESSDFFNSKGELVLSGLSEWSDSDGDSDAHSEAGSDASSVSANSITHYRPESPNLPELSNVEVPNGEITRPKENAEISENVKSKESESVKSNVTSDILNDECQDTTSNENTKSRTNGNVSSYITNIEEVEMQASELQEHISNSAGNLLQFSFDKYKSPNYGVRYSPGFGRQGINILKPSANSGWRVPPGLENDPQIYTRAPNFRTPGGYKPPKFVKPPRDLTEEQVRDEVKKMYAFPEEKENDRESGDSTSDDKKPTKPKKNVQVTFSDVEITKKCGGDDQTDNCNSAKAEDIEDQIIKDDKVENVSPNLKFDFTNGSKHPPEFGGKLIGMKGKPTKRKLTNGSSDVVPASTFGSKDLSKQEIKEKPIIRTRAWVTGTGDRKISSKVGAESSDLSSATVPSLPSLDTETKKKVNFMDMDKLYRDIRDTKLRMNEDMKKSTESLKALAISDVRAETHGINFDYDQNYSFASSNESKSGNISIRDDMHHMVSRETNGMSQLQSPTSFQNFRVIKKPSSEKEKYKKNSMSYLSGRSIDPYNRQPATNTSELAKDNFETLSGSDLDSILKEADIELDDFEDILDKFSEEMPIDELFGAAAAYSKNEKGEEMVYSLADQTELSDWAKSGAGEYLEKFHEEKYKRQRCESEIQNLQRELLELKQQNAVLEGGLKKKDAMFLHISMIWNRLSKEWKNHEAYSKSATAKLQSDQHVLITACRQNKERILQYEKELAKAIELADSFKAKVQEVEEEKANVLRSLQEENIESRDRVKRVENLLQECQREKEETVAALRASQIRLDERTAKHDDIYKELIEWRTKANENQNKCEKILEDKAALENQLKCLSDLQISLETQVTSLTEELQGETETKSRLEREFETSMCQKVQEEANRLHEYYNTQVKEILTSATEKAAAVEASLLNNMKKASVEADQKLNECKARYKAEIENMRTKYEAEMKVLIRENTHKQNLIAATAQQLQSGELAVSQTSDRLQSIISNMKPHGSSYHSYVPHRENGPSVAPPSYQFSNGLSSKSARQQQQHQSHVNPSASSSVDTSPASQANFDPTHFLRYNASTPIVSLASKSNISLSSMGGNSYNPNGKINRPDFLQLQLPPLDHLLSNPKLLHVISEMSVSNQGLGSVTARSTSTSHFVQNPLLSSAYGDSVGLDPYTCHTNKIKSVSQCPTAAYLTTVEPPIAAEIPVRLGNPSQVQQQQQEDPVIIAMATQPNSSDRMQIPQQPTTSCSQTVIEPGLHKCLQALVKCYTEKLDQLHLDNSNNTSTADFENVDSLTAAGVTKISTTSISHSVSTSSCNSSDTQINKSSNHNVVTRVENKMCKRNKGSGVEGEYNTNTSVTISHQTNVKSTDKSSSSSHNFKRPWK